MLRQVLGGSLLGSTSAVQQLPLEKRQVGLEERDDKRSEREIGGLLELAVKFFYGYSGIHESKDKGSDLLPNLWRDIIAKLL